MAVLCQGPLVGQLFRRLLDGSNAGKASGSRARTRHTPTHCAAAALLHCCLLRRAFLIFRRLMRVVQPPGMLSSTRPHLC